MKKLYLARHGATRYSQERRYLGWQELGLTKAGRQQARSLGNELQGLSFSQVWRSDLLRCRETARLAGFSQAQVSPQLREFDFGRIEGLTWEELSAEDKLSIVHWSPEFCPGTESLGDFQKRILSFCWELPPGQHLLICHGGVTLVLQQALNLPSTKQNPGQVVALDFPLERS